MHGLSEDGQRTWHRRLIAGAGVAVLAAAGYLAHAENSRRTRPVDATTSHASKPVPSVAPAPDLSPRAPSTSVNLDEMRRRQRLYEVESLHGSIVWYENPRPDDPRLKRQVWEGRCNIHKPCPKPRALPRCQPGATAATWGSVRERARSLQGTVVEVSGKLDLAPTGLSKGPNCAPCCHRSGVDIVLDDRDQETVLEDSSHALGLEGYRCVGDESKGCCNALADGSEVIATGRLEPLPGGIDWQELLWQLRDVSLCVTAPAAKARLSTTISKLPIQPRPARTR